MESKPAAASQVQKSYGGRYPVTTEGRIVGVLLMVLGIGLVGAVIAAVTAWMMARVEAERRRSSHIS